MLGDWTEKGYIRERFVGDTSTKLKQNPNMAFLDDSSESVPQVVHFLFNCIRVELIRFLCLLHCYEFCITVTNEKCSYIRQKTVLIIIVFLVINIGNTYNQYTISTLIITSYHVDYV